MDLLNYGRSCRSGKFVNRTFLVGTMGDVEDFVANSKSSSAFGTYAKYYNEV